MGARFTKWRAVITMGEGLPSWGCIEANAHALARYAVLCQEVGLVPLSSRKCSWMATSRWSSAARRRRGCCKGFLPSFTRKARWWKG